MKGRVSTALGLAGLFVGLLGASSAEASIPRDLSRSALTAGPASDPLAAAPLLGLPSLTQQLRATEERASKAAECAALCELAAGIEAHPFGRAVVGTPFGTQDAWGNYRFTSELTTSHNRFGYTGHYWDKEASLYYAKARYYDPFTARFTQADSFLGTIDDPPSLHRYQYAHANPTSYWDPTGYEILPASCYTGGNCDARKSSGPLPEERALFKFAGDTANGVANLLGTTAAAIDPITAIRDPGTAQFARDQLSQVPGQVHGAISDWGRDVGTISANPSVVMDAIEELGEERAREAYFGGVLMSATAVQGGSQLVRSGGRLGATAVSEARTAIPALRHSISEFSDRLYLKPMPPDLLRGTTIGVNGASVYRGTLGRIGLRSTEVLRLEAEVSAKVTRTGAALDRWLMSNRARAHRKYGWVAELYQDLVSKPSATASELNFAKGIRGRFLDRQMNDWMADTYGPRFPNMRLDQTVPGSGKRLRPDVYIPDLGGTSVILDFGGPSKINGISKYEGLADILIPMVPRTWR